MNMNIIQQKLLDYRCQTVDEQDHALKEIAQEIALMALSRSNFFQVAAFQGGTCLRILYGLDRFSEDLDFVLLEPDRDFQWEKFTKNIDEEFRSYGYTLEVVNKAKLDKVVKTAFLKADSKGGLLILKDSRTNRPKIQIKLEIDTNPPSGSVEEIKILDFPLAFSVKTQDLPSLFAGKCAALLCREFLKGRDWYDFLWYVARSTPINLNLLTHRLNQEGPWEGQHVQATPAWLLRTLEEKIQAIDWQHAKRDVSRFLRKHELPTLDLWSGEFFQNRLEKLASYLKSSN